MSIIITVLCIKAFLLYCFIYTNIFMIIVITCEHCHYCFIHTSALSFVIYKRALLFVIHT